jgi:hypothetical protein
LEVQCFFNIDDGQKGKKVLSTFTDRPHVERLIHRSSSALSLRLFGADITTAGRDAAQQKKSSAATPDRTSPPLKDDEADMNIGNNTITVDS